MNAAVLLPVGAISIAHIVYNFVLLPAIQRGAANFSWIWGALGILVLGSSVMAGTLLKSHSGIAIMATVSTGYRRAAELLMVSISAPGFLKLDRDPWSYWTWLLAGEGCAWFFLGWIGRLIRLAVAARRLP